MEHGFDQKIPINTIMKQIGYNNVHCWLAGFKWSWPSQWWLAR